MIRRLERLSWSPPWLAALVWGCAGAALSVPLWWLLHALGVNTAHAVTSPLVAGLTFSLAMGLHYSYRSRLDPSHPPRHPGP